LALVLMLGLTVPLGAAPVQVQSVTWESAMNRSLDWISNTVRQPVVGSVGGEWAVLALARAGRIDAHDRWTQVWLADLNRTLTEVDRLQRSYDIHNPPSVGTFPASLRRWTDFQRVTLALSALGLDAANHNGHDLTAVFSNYIPAQQRHALNQTINVDTFALIALNSMSYSGDIDDFIQSLINAQRADGTWSLNPAAPVSAMDLDITAMALQALAPHYDSGDARVSDAVSRALSWLHQQSFPDPEGTAQMIVALTALGPSFAAEAAHYVNHLLRWFDGTSGGFSRPAPTDPVNLMATEQAAYALVAYWRFVNNLAALYDMSDAFACASKPEAVVPDAPIVYKWVRNAFLPILPKFLPVYP